MTMKSLVALLALSVMLSSRAGAAEPSAAPTPESAAVLKVVQQFFEAMQARDADGIRRVWQPETQFSLGVRKDGGHAVAHETIEELTAELMKDNQPWLERVWHPTVHVEGRLAVVWARYDFHVGGQFTHNGTDCYTLFKTDAGWRIVGLVFTVEPGGLTENPAGPPH